MTRGHRREVNHRFVVPRGIPGTRRAEIGGNPRLSRRARAATLDGMAVSILLVDDNQEYRDNLVEVLTARGHAVDPTTSIPEAIDAARTRPYGFVCVEPGASPARVAGEYDQLRRLLPHAAFAVNTAWPELWFASDIGRLDGAEVLTKPCGMAQLLAAVAAVEREAEGGNSA